MLSQLDDNSLLYLVAYFLQKLSPAEYNYEIYDKKLLAIICCFEEWRLKLEKTGMPVQMLIDYKNLKYFITTKKLILRQVR